MLYNYIQIKYYFINLYCVIYYCILNKSDFLKFLIILLKCCIYSRVMKVCILGGTGYLGTKIITELIKGDNYVVCVCRKDSKSKKEFFNNNKVEYVVSDYLVLRDLFANTKFDCIINASCTYMKGARIDDIVESNLIFPMRVLSLAVENYYGINSEFNNYNSIKLNSEISHLKTKKESTNIKQLRFISMGTGLPDNFNLYTYTKKQFNKMGHFFSKEYGLEFINLELENYYGEFEPKNRFLPSVIEKMKNNEDIPLTQGEQLRDFVYINDVINAIMLIATKKDLPPYMDVPLGSGNASSIKELVMYIKELMNSKSNLQYGKVPLRPNEPSSFSNLAMYKMLGGKIEYNWKDGIKIMLEKEGIL